VLSGGKNTLQITILNYLKSRDILKSIIVDGTRIISHGLIETTPLRVMRDGHSWGKGKIETTSQHTLLVPMGSVLEVFSVMSSSHTNVVGE
jgi:hypothetical protein